MVMLKATVNSFIGSKLRIEVAEAGSEDMRRLKTAAESRFPIFTQGGGKEAFSGDETKRKEDRMPMSSAALEES